MHKRWMAMLLAAGLALQLAGPAVAHQVVDGQSASGNKTGDPVAGLAPGSLWKLMQVDANGRLVVIDATGDNWDYRSLVINDTTTVGAGLSALTNMGVAFTAESTTVIPSGAFKKFALFFKVDPAAGDTSTLIRYAVQVRGHGTQTADSASSFVWKGWGAAPTTGSAVDSLGQYVAAPFSGGGYNVAISGETIVEFNPKLGRGTGAFQAMGGPVGQMVMLGPRGEGFWAPYMSVRVRCLTGASKPRIQMSIGMAP